ncbi:phosphatase PAP2 family protein [Streptomyces sp. NBC_00252]|uniref:phosphatase PAP2 family protein n=1 Tax=Streptomyces sp. NBC_00252 TaxID=2975691 RepID=UPI002E2B3C64|nr:phosphatase PAP2 family protein [Streptomyces sp. NBC_00252]
MRARRPWDGRRAGPARTDSKSFGVRCIVGRVVPRPRAGSLGLCYPLATFTVILATANHFVTDAAAGAATLATGFLIQRLLTGRPAYPTLRRNALTASQP